MLTQAQLTMSITDKLQNYRKVQAFNEIARSILQDGSTQNFQNLYHVLVGQFYSNSYKTSPWHCLLEQQFMQQHHLVYDVHPTYSKKPIHKWVGWIAQTISVARKRIIRNIQQQYKTSAHGRRLILKRSTINFPTNKNSQISRNDGKFAPWMVLLPDGTTLADQPQLPKDTLIPSHLPNVYTPTQTTKVLSLIHI